MFLKMFHSLHNIKGGENICGCFSILGGFLIHLTYGYLYSLTNMVPYIMGYLITFMDPKLSVQTSVWFSAVSFALYGFSMPLGGFLSSKIGYRPVLALSCFLLRQFDDPEVLTRLPNVFLILGAILLITQIIGFILLHPKPKFNFKEGRIEVLDEDSSLNSQIKDECSKHHTWPTILSCRFLSIMLFGQTFISDDKYLSTVVTVTAVFNSGGRILWGSVVDRFSYKVPFCAVSLTWAMLLFTLPWIGITSGLTARILYFVWGIGNFIFLSSVSTLAPATIGSMFGGKNMAVNYGIMATARAIGCPLCAFILTFINSRNLYFIQFTICGCASLIAFFLAVWIDDHKISSSLNCCSLCSKTCSKVRVQRK
ncbi:Oxalate:formate antiporter [Schistosoma japonicum]|nr:Oxalate:formate antiporter [Schistosoma japonicum]